MRFYAFILATARIFSRQIDPLVTFFTLGGQKNRARKTRAKRGPRPSIISSAFANAVRTFTEAEGNGLRNDGSILWPP
jgi:hypothetical protein